MHLIKKAEDHLELINRLIKIIENCNEQQLYDIDIICFQNDEMYFENVDELYEFIVESNSLKNVSKDEFCKKYSFDGIEKHLVIEGITDELIDDCEVFDSKKLACIYMMKRLDTNNEQAFDELKTYLENL